MLILGSQGESPEIQILRPQLRMEQEDTEVHQVNFIPVHSLFHTEGTSIGG